MRGIEPPCAAWEAAVLPLNYTREEIFDFRFPIDDCNRNKFVFTNRLCTGNPGQRPVSLTTFCSADLPLRTADATAVIAQTITATKSRRPLHSRHFCRPTRRAPFILPSDHAITPICRFGVAPALAAVRIGYLIVVIAIDANDVIVAPWVEVLPSVADRWLFRYLIWG